MLHALTKVFRRQVESQITELINKIVPGKLTPAQYSETCGELRGLQVALEIMEQAMRDLNGGDSE